MSAPAGALFCMLASRHLRRIAYVAEMLQPVSMPKVGVNGFGFMMLLCNFCIFCKEHIRILSHALRVLRSADHQIRLPFDVDTGIGFRFGNGYVQGEKRSHTIRAFPCLGV